jgi:hypothetical protein
MCAVSPLPSDDDSGLQHPHPRNSFRSGTVSPPRAAADDDKTGDVNENKDDLDVDLDAEVRTSLSTATKTATPGVVAVSPSSVDDRSRNGNHVVQEKEKAGV